MRLTPRDTAPTVSFLVKKEVKEMGIVDRLRLLLHVVLDVSWDLLHELLVDIKDAILQAVQFFRTGNFQAGFNAVIQVIAMVETLWSQVGQAITDLLDVFRTSNVGTKAGRAGRSIQVTV